MTSFDEIIDLAMITIRDYGLDNLIRLNPEIFKQYMDGLLIKAVPKFVGCLQSLTYDLSERVFISQLTHKEKDILSDLIVEVWLKTKINDATQIQLKMTNREFKTHSEAQNLREKSEYLFKIREKYKQDIVDYQLENLNKLSFFQGGE